MCRLHAQARNYAASSSAVDVSSSVTWLKVTRERARVGGRARCTQPISHASYPAGWSLRLGSARERGLRCWGRVGQRHPPLRSRQQHSSSGRSRLWAGAMATAGEAAGLGSRQRLASVSGWCGGAFSWLQGLGTKLKLGNDGHQPDHGAGKISPLPHFLSTHRSDPGKRSGVKPQGLPGPDECSQAEGNGALGRFSGCSLIKYCLSWICLWVPEGPFPNPFGFSIFGGLSLTVLCFPTLWSPPPTLCSVLHLTSWKP